MRQWGIQLVEHSITQEISMFPQCFWTNLALYVLHTPHVHAVRNQFSQFPLCNVYQLWQPDELHQLLLGLVKHFLHWLLKYLKARNVKDQFDSGFTSVP
jgi:hypothetical protein